jgi:cholesterol transport system auxiliary component
MKTPSRLAVLALALALAACLGGGPPPKLYTLMPATDLPANLPNLPAQLLVETPESSDALNTRQIALSHAALNFDYFAGADWTDNAPALVQTLLVESFESSGHVTAVARESLALKGEYILRPELRHFEAEYAKEDAPPTIKVVLGLTLVKMPDRNIVGHHDATATTKATENSVPAVVTAFDQALRQVLSDSVAWTLTAAKP